MSGTEDDGSIRIPPEVLARVRRESHVDATEADVRDSILEAALGPSVVACPVCQGAGIVSETSAAEWRRKAMRDSDTAIEP